MAKKAAPEGAFQALKLALRQKEPAHLYIFHGEEDYLRTYYLEKLRGQILTGFADDFNLHRFDAQTMDLSAFADAVEAIPMMAEASFVQVDDVDLYQMDADDRERMAAILSDIPDYCYVVFIYDALPWKPDKRLRKLNSAVEQNAQIVEFARQSEQELVSWVARHFASFSKAISPDLCRYLINQCGASMSAMASEISKIASYATAPNITRADIDAVVEPVLDAVVFQLTDAIAEGKYARALQILRTLCKMQEEPIPILGAVGAQLRKAAAARTLSASGKGPDALMKLYGMGSYPAQKAFSFARRVPDGFFRTALPLCAETDYRLKTSYDDPQRLLELLVLRLAQEAGHG